jgi:predicted transcriptional regulator
MSTVVLEVRSLDQTLADAARAMHGLADEQDARIGFSTPELIWQVLTAKRWELLQAMCGAGPLSIRETARRIGRDVKAVHGDITVLLHAGLLTRSARGQVEFAFDAVKVEIFLKAA